MTLIFRSQTCPACGQRMEDVSEGYKLYICLNIDCLRFGYEHAVRAVEDSAD